MSSAARRFDRRGLPVVVGTALALWLWLPVPSGSEERFRFAPFDEVHLYVPPVEPTSVALFLSGDGGWNLGVVSMAEHLQGLGALVVGIDVTRVITSIDTAGSGCGYPAGSLEELSRAVQLRQRLPEYLRPVLVGYSSGATLVYTALASAPPETFQGGLSLGFCPDLSLKRPLCRGRGLVSRPGAKPASFVFEPMAELAVPWIALQGEIDQVCEPATTRRFVAAIPSASLISLPRVGHGFSVARNWQAELDTAYRRLASPLAEEHAPALPGVADLPLVEVRPEGAREGDALAVLLSGDGGWAGLDRSLADGLAKAGLPVVGWSSLRYFWTPRTPEAAAADLGRILERYGEQWGKRRFVLIGYSFGADALPFLVNRLPAALRERVAGVALLGLSQSAQFEFHVTGWLGVGSGGRPTAPELEGLADLPLVCVMGRDERDSGCAAAPPADRVELPGGHHFGGDSASLVRAVLRLVKPAAGAP